MQYHSAQTCGLRYTAAEAVKPGLSRGGGLRTPCAFQQTREGFLQELTFIPYQDERSV